MFTPQMGWGRMGEDGGGCGRVREGATVH